MATKATMATSKAQKAAEKSGAVQSAVNLPQAPLANLPEGFSVVRRVTMPSLSLKKQGEMRVLKFLDAWRVSTVQGKPILKDGKPTGEFEKPATVCNVVDVTTGEAYVLLGSTVVIKNLEENYPDNGYIDRIFAITNRGRIKEGQRYANFDIAEVSAND